MKDSGSQRFHLTFAGQLLPDTSREQAQQSLARFFGVADPNAVAVFFSGREVALRRNLEHAEAYRLYRQLRAVGIICEVCAIEDMPPRVDPAKTAADTSTKPPSAKPLASRPTPLPAPASAPNLFALRPALTARSKKQSKEDALLATLLWASACAALLVLILAVLLGFSARPPAEARTGPLALASLKNQSLLMLTRSALLLHERSGIAKQRVAAEDLGLERLDAPLAIAKNGDLLLNGARKGEAFSLQRCQLELNTCRPFFLDTTDVQVSAVAQSLLGDTLFLLGPTGKLLRSSDQGAVLAQTTLPTPWGYPRLLASDGLLLIPDADGPLLGIHRPETDRFAEQLDALLLMPPEAAAAGLNRIQDIAVTMRHRWALLDKDGANSLLFRFDNQWGDAQLIDLPADVNPRFLHAWRDKILLASPTSGSIARYSSDGQREAPFESTLLRQDLTKSGLLYDRQGLWRDLGLGLASALAVAAGLLALLNGAGLHALSALPQQRTALLDPMPAGVDWQLRKPSHAHILNILTVSVTSALLIAACVLLVKGHWITALTLLPAIIGGGLAGWWIKIGSGGHLGLLGRRIVAVDYQGRYFYGDRGHLCANQSFICAPAVVLSGSLADLKNRGSRTTLNPTNEVAEPTRLGPLATLGLLWRLRHPWLRALLSLCGGWLVAACGTLAV